MILRATKNRRTIFFLIFDTIIFCLSIYFAFLLRFSGEIPEIFERGMIYGGIILVSSKLVLMWIFRLYKVPWRFFGLNEARKIFLVTILSAGILYTIFISYDEFFNRPAGMQATVTVTRDILDAWGSSESAKAKMQIAYL